MRYKHANRRPAVVAIWIALAGVLLIATLGLMMDTAYGLLAGHQLQNAADAAALAGALEVKADIVQARLAAQTLGLANKVVSVPGPLEVQLLLNESNVSDGDIVVGRYDRQTRFFDPAIPEVNAVKVIARRDSAAPHTPLPLLFGPAFGVDAVDVTRSAIAIIAGTTGGGLIALCCDCYCSLEFSGNTDLVLQAAPGWEGDTAIQVNSDDPCAMCGDGSALILEAPETNIVGDACWTGHPTLDTFINPDSPSMPDPLAGLPAPPCGQPALPPCVPPAPPCGESALPCGLPDLGSIRGSGTYSPGYYSGGLEIHATGDFVVLEPGVYVMDGEGVYVNGGNLDAQGVMFYVIGTGKVYLAGNGIIAISPSVDEADPYWGISIFQDRQNCNEAVIIGTSAMDLEGTFYFPVAPVEIGGEGISIGNQLIAWSMWIHGKGTFTIQYDGRFPAPGAKVFLVE